MNPLWNGLWKENADKSSVLEAATISIESAADRSFFLIESGGERIRLRCRHGASCRSLFSLQPAHGIARSGAAYNLNAKGTELQIRTWRLVADGSRPTDIDTYMRSAPGAGFPGTWRKVHSKEAPTTWRISVHEDRMTLATTDGEVKISFSLKEANTPQGACMAFGPGRTNCYTVLGPSKFLERSLRQGILVAQSVGTLSPDGLSMTEEHTDSPSEAKPIHIVYDRVSPSAPH